MACSSLSDIQAVTSGQRGHAVNNETGSPTDLFTELILTCINADSDGKIYFRCRLYTVLVL